MNSFVGLYENSYQDREIIGDASAMRVRPLY